MIKKQTVIDQIELPGGTTARGLQVRLGLLIVDNDVEESRKYHRFQIGVPEIADDAMRKAVEVHLVAMGYPAIPADEWAKVAALLKSTK